jgi:hypothetical protein
LLISNITIKFLQVTRIKFIDRILIASLIKLIFRMPQITISTSKPPHRSLITWLKRKLCNLTIRGHFLISNSFQFHIKSIYFWILALKFIHNCRLRGIFKRFLIVLIRKLYMNQLLLLAYKVKILIMLIVQDLWFQPKTSYLNLTKQLIRILKQHLAHQGRVLIVHTLKKKTLLMVNL